MRIFYRSIKESLKALLRKPLARNLRILLWLLWVERDSRALDRVSDKLDIQKLTLQRLDLFSREKSGPTLFILGSGASVNQLAPAQFDQIEAGCSIGINVWAAHEFVPDCYAFESGGYPPTSEEIEHRNYLTESLKRPEVLTKNPTFMILRPSSPSDPQQFIAVPEELNHRRRLYGRANLVGCDQGSLPLDLKAVVKKFLSCNKYCAVLPDNGATVVRLIFLGAKLGFKKIVLVGVDLSNSPYFWFENPYKSLKPELRSLFPRPVRRTHDTLETLNRPFNTRHFLVQLAQVLSDLGVCQIFAATEESRLGGQLDLYSWDTGTRAD